MPSLNLRNPLRRDPNRPTLKQRAAALKAAAARVIRGRRGVELTDQPSSASLLLGNAADRRATAFKAPERASQDAGGGVLGRTSAADGHAPHQESAMGRHESFDPTSAIPFSLGTMGEALPAPGSPEAMEAFGAACRFVDAASRLSDADIKALKIGTGLQYWTSDVIQQAQMGNFSHVMPEDVEAAKATPKARLDELLILALRRDLRMAEAAHSSRIRELHALVYGDEPDPDDGSEAPAADEPDIAQAIEAHRTAQTALTAASWAHDKDHVRQAGGDTSDEAMAAAQTAWEAADAAETQAWARLLKVRPANPAGLLQMLRYIGGATTALESVTSPGAFARDIAEAAETALSGKGAEAVDWYSPPPGFMAFPAIEPTGFLNIRYGIVAELERLRGIARAEYTRREPLFDEAFGQGEREARLSALRDELRLSALDAAIADPKARSGTASAAGADPILAAIEASRAAQAAVEAWSTAIKTRGGPPTEEDFADEDRLTEAQSEARSRVIDTVPTTPAGRLALLEYLRWQMGLYGYANGNLPDRDSYFWRFAYRSLATALAWGGPAVGPSYEASADAALIALGRAFDVATVRDREANDAATAAEARAEARMPERPACLFFRVEDAPFCLRKLHSHPEALAGQPVTPGDLGWMTRRPAQREVWVDAPPGSKGWNMMPGKVPQIVPWPEAQARIDEIEAAFKTWNLEQDRILEEVGSWAADEAVSAASEVAASLARRIASQPAHTIEGMRAKLRVAAFYSACEPDTPEGEGYPGEAAIRSLYRDTPGIEISTDPSDVRIVPEA